MYLMHSEVSIILPDIVILLFSKISRTSGALNQPLKQFEALSSCLEDMLFGPGY